VNKRRIHNGALAQRQATIPQVAIDHGQNPCCQFVLFQQTTEVLDDYFVGNVLQAWPRALAQYGCLELPSPIAGSV